ncbi:LOW QUALITY PROTEIN: protein phosphatase 1 regulatory subunit 12C, partial [Ammospiza caudacuta]|uniref:LOW QUALITY PROTEIN: protein phosphatase 1 regulatory subunit 12C n=1 Tax=Ammospiza caudacuta TaxID=2857398 RepID=UPI00273965CC
AAAAAARERRREQLRRWEEAAAAAPGAGEAAARPGPPRVRFERQAEFRAVCAGAELAEARAMVMAPEGGGRALLGGANADGISALHQACIDENMEVVQFLVESGADVNQADNEGWTPLHVAAACGCRHIAQYLLDHGADAAAVTCDLELPLEVAEDEALEELLRAELQRRGVEVAAAKRAEEERMLRDTRLWLDSGQLRDCPHPATGASALHVAAAKGYIEVMRLLLAAGYDPDVRDKDGWTPLHAAAHWGVEEACRLLCEHLCDMSPQNNVGQRPCDLADEETLPLLEELQRRQIHLRRQKDPGAPPPPPAATEGAPPPTGGSKQRRTSVSRRSSREKLSLLQARERVGEGALPPPLSPPGGGGAESDEGGASEGEGPEGEPRPQAGDSPEAPPPNGPSPPLPVRPLPPPSINGQRGGARARPRPHRPPSPPPGLSAGPAPWGRGQAAPGTRPPPRPRPPCAAPPPPRACRPRPRVRSPPAAPPPPRDPPAPPPPRPEPPGTPQPRVRRPFQPPARDEESESQRKARSRLMRQARRATQGVTLTELRAAEQGIGRAAEGRGQEQPIRDEGGREPADPPQVPPGGSGPAPTPEEAPPPPSHAPAPPPNGLRPPPAPPFDYQQLFQELWVENERIREQLQEAELALTQSRLELERVTQRQERSAERPARLELERFERRALELKAAELEEELKALSDLRADNQRLKDENAALIRVISKLSK